MHAGSHAAAVVLPVYTRTQQAALRLGEPVCSVGRPATWPSSPEADRLLGLLQLRDEII